MNKYYIFINIIFIYTPLLLGILHCSINKRRPVYETLLIYFAWMNIALKNGLLGLELTILGHGLLSHLHWHPHSMFFLYGIALLLCCGIYFAMLFLKNKTYLFIFCKAYAIFLLVTAIFIFYLMLNHPQYPLREDILLYGFGDVLTAAILYLLAMMGQQKWNQKLSLSKNYTACQ